MSDLIEKASPLAEVVTLDPQTYVVAVYKPFLERFEEAKKTSTDTDYKIATTAGMKTAIERRAAFRDLRIELEKERKARKAPVLEIGKLIDSRAAALSEQIEVEELAHDKLIKAEEQRKEAEKAERERIEKARVDALHAKIGAIRKRADDAAGLGAEAINSAWESLKDMVISADEYQQLSGAAMQAQAETLDRLSKMHAVAEAAEVEAARLAAERIELERLRAEAAERERAAAQERADAEERARVVREAAEAEQKRLQAALDAENARQRAELERQQAELCAQQQAIAEQQAELERQKQEAAAAEQRRLDEAAAEEQRRIDEEAERERRRVADVEAHAEGIRRAAEEKRQREEAAETLRQAEIKAARRPSDDTLIRFIQRGMHHAGLEEPPVADVIDWLEGFDAEDARLRLL